MRLNSRHANEQTNGQGHQRWPVQLFRLTAVFRQAFAPGAAGGGAEKMQNAHYCANLWRETRSLLGSIQGYVWERARWALGQCGLCGAGDRSPTKSMRVDKSVKVVADNATWQVVEALEATMRKCDIDVLDGIASKTESNNEAEVTPTATQKILEADAGTHKADGSPLSAKSTSYSQKSTASAKSCGGSNSAQSQRPSSCHSPESEPELELVSPIEQPQPFDELIVDDVEEAPPTDPEPEPEPDPEPEPALKRIESVSSLVSKTESIKTQLEDATPQLSRAQSLKSLAIEEQIEETNSFVLVEPLQQDLASTPNAQDELPIHSRSISLDSLYGGRPASKQDSLDNSTTTDNSSQGGSQLGHSNPNAKHTPLKQKSKTLYFLRNQRRVSPVKQAIKISQAELFPPNMTRFEKPREAMLKTFEQLDSANWETNITGLKSMVRLMRYHADYLDHHMHMVCIHLTRSVRNLRSQVARAACQAATELFTLKSKYLELECDDLVCALLHRSADTNRFLRADATRALESMVDNVQPPKALNLLALKGAQHQNALVRTTTAKLLFRLVERLGSDRIYSMSRDHRDKFFLVGANLLMEGSLETRGYAKSLFRSLSQHESYQRLLLEIIPSRTYKNIEKALRSIS